MQIEMLRTKIHRATVTEADVDYEGSISIDPDLLEVADILSYEAVHVWNVTNGYRLVTYAIDGKRGTGEVKINGAAALHTAPGDIVIIAAFARFNGPVDGYKPRVVVLGEKNSIVSVSTDHTFFDIRKR